MGTHLEETIEWTNSDGLSTTFRGQKLSKFIAHNKRNILVGSGKDGDVFKMKYKLADGKFVYIAIKQLKVKNRTEKHKQVEKEFAQEFAKMMDKTHENLVRFYGVVKFQEKAMIIMALCDGDLKKLRKRVQGKLDPLVTIGAINEWQKENDILPEALVCRVFACVLHGLVYLYRTFGIYHADIKPANIMYKKTGAGGCIFKIGDFSSAATKIVSRMTGAMPVSNTRLYITPEIAIDPTINISQTTDVWALGIALGEFSTGKHPIRNWTLRRHGVTLPPGETLAVVHITNDLQNRDMESTEMAYPFDAAFSDEFMELYRNMNQANKNKRQRYQSPNPNGVPANKEDLNYTSYECYPRPEDYTGPNEGLWDTEIFGKYRNETFVTQDTEEHGRYKAMVDIIFPPRD